MELNKIYQGDSRCMDKIDDESVHLTVTSPPYYVGKKYEKYLPTIDDYFQMLYDVFAENVRITVPGGKIIVNVGDIAVGSHYNEGFPQELMVMSKIDEFLKTVDTYLYARAVWLKDEPWNNSSHVTFHSKVQHAEYRLLPAWEYVFVFRKGKEPRKDRSPESGRWIDKHLEWKRWVNGQWAFRSVSRNDFHEAMFPEELVNRCVRMYSFPGDVVFDPFMGSGTTAVVAKKLGRHYLGYELNPKYVKLSENQLDGITDDMVEIQKEYRDKTVNKELQEDMF
jgi:site-specific DNA-methyltransferase (adenine-specific)